MEPTSLLLSTGQAANRLGAGKTNMLDGRIRVCVADIAAFIDAMPKGYVPGQVVRRPSDVERLEDRDTVGGDGTGGARPGVRS